LADKSAKPYDILSAATLILSVTSPYSVPYASAWRRIENVARDPKNPGSLDALAVLANEQALPPMRAVGNNPSLSLDTAPRPKPPNAGGGFPGIAGGTPPPGSPPQTTTGEETRRQVAVSSRRHSATSSHGEDDEPVRSGKRAGKSSGCPPLSQASGA